MNVCCCFFFAKGRLGGNARPPRSTALRKGDCLLRKRTATRSEHGRSAKLRRGQEAHRDDAALPQTYTHTTYRPRETFMNL